MYQPRIGDLIRLKTYDAAITGLILDINPVKIWWIEIDRVEVGNKQTTTWLNYADFYLMAQIEE